jgi:surfeit locus 1 family protein
MGSRVFAPSLLMTAAMVLACVAFINLGQWQWRKGQLRQQEWDRYARGADSVRTLGDSGMGDVPRFQRVSLAGRYDGAHQLLLDNRSHQGLPGYEVLTPLVRADGRVALVDRGWVPFTGVRAHLPDVTLASPGKEVAVSGRSDELPAAGLPSGRAPPPPEGGWPKVTSFPTMPELAQALGLSGTRLEPRILLLDPDQPQGYVRDWQPPGMSPLRHLSYAIQWWAFAALAVILWVTMSLKRRTDA